MLFRKAVCLSMFAALVILALAAGGIALSQDRAPTAAAPPPPKAVAAAEPVGGVPVVAGFEPVATAPQALSRPPESEQEAGPSRPAPGDSAPANAHYQQLITRGYQVPTAGFGARPAVYGLQVKPSHEDDPEMQKLAEADSKMEQEAKDLVEQYQKATSDDQRAELKAKLEELCNQHFDVRQQRRELEISRLEHRLGGIRASIKKRNEARDFIVRLRVSQLLGEIELDEWALPGRAASKSRGAEIRVYNPPGAAASDPFGRREESGPLNRATIPARR